MDWIVGIASLVAMVIATAALRRISQMQAEISRKFEIALRSALGHLKADAEENAKLIKTMSERILAVEKKVDQSKHAQANKQAEIDKLKAENRRLRQKPAAKGHPAKPAR
ncbi:MAG: hypothetical protein ACE5GT_02685 [Rhodospirillales bacterium]